MQNPKFETVTTCKTVERLEMTDIEYLAWWAEYSSEYRCADLSTSGVDMQNERQGYLVLYQGGTDQEYYSWSPKEIMDAALLPPLIKIDLDTLAVDPGFQETVTLVRGRLDAVQRELSKTRVATFTLPENCNDPSEIISALVTSLTVASKTIESACPEISEVADTSIRPAEPGHSPLFEKAHAEFLKKLSVTSLPEALEAALVVYTDGLTYTEE